MPKLTDNQNLILYYINKNSVLCLRDNFAATFIRKAIKRMEELDFILRIDEDKTNFYAWRLTTKGQAIADYLKIDDSEYNQWRGKHAMIFDNYDMRIEKEYHQANRRKELMEMPYREYLLTPEWDKRRKEALARAGYACEHCRQKTKLQVHHKTYERRGNEWDEDLIALCYECHQKMHGKTITIPVDVVGATSVLLLHFKYSERDELIFRLNAESYMNVTLDNMDDLAFSLRRFLKEEQFLELSTKMSDFLKPDEDSAES